ncbi:hypothetical protein Ab1vBOLIVR2_gp56 [Agrobacterium phage OLIVR2]|nr:hypothetical protein Ab1vBOLIVR2_gp56 [Agrobacterium phage OLIVR2]QIW87466.1 hypothetical protein Ab1vBOLIVR3_gp56 [Agrobacterium phage OLIVR3]
MRTTLGPLTALISKARQSSSGDSTIQQYCMYEIRVML